MKTSLRNAALAAVALCLSAAVAAQPAKPREPVDSGAIIMPPPTDEKAVKPAPKNVDPEMAVPPVRKETRAEGKPEKIPARKKSKQADCKGRAELCKQDSAK